MSYVLSYETITDLTKLPAGKHFVILERESYMSYSGYEDRPGCSSGGTTEYHILIRRYKDEPTWRSAVEDLTKNNNGYSRRDFKAAIITIPEVTVSVAVSIGG